MDDTPKPRAFATAMLFGQPPDCYLATHVCVGPSIEVATAHAVAGYMRNMQAQGITLPSLTMVNAMEIEDGLIRAYVNGGKPGEVTPLRVVPGEAQQAQPHQAGPLAGEFRPALWPSPIGQSLPPNGDGDAA